MSSACLSGESGGSEFDKWVIEASVCALIEYALLERDAHPELYYATSDLIEEIANDFCPASYVRWELNFLGELGYGLDLTECAATGSNDNLMYVSPKSGRAVSALAGEPYRDKLLSLPDFLLKNEFLQGITDAEILAGLALCGYFLEKNVFSPTGKTIPLARQRLSGIISRLAA